MKIKVSELEGEKLAEWAARAQGWNVSGDTIGIPYQVSDDGDIDFSLMPTEDYRPDINGGQAMELVKKFNILLYPLFNRGYFATPIRSYTYEEEAIYSEGQSGETPEIAICRAVVASVYGEYVDDSSTE